MPGYEIYVLLICDHPAILSILQTSLDEVAYRRRNEVSIHTRYTSSLQESFILIHEIAPSITLISLGQQSQAELVEMVKLIRQNIITKHQRIIVVSDLLDEYTSEVLNDKLGVAPIIFHPFSWEMANELLMELSESARTFIQQRGMVNEDLEARYIPYIQESIKSSVSSAVTEVLAELAHYTGLPGPAAADSTLEDLRSQRQNKELAYETLFFDWRHIGLAANDIFGREFGNYWITELGNIIRNETEAIRGEHSDIQVAPYHYGKGDEFVVVFAANFSIWERRLRYVATKFAKSIQLQLRRRVEVIYREERKKLGDPHYEYHFLVGPRVKDKAGRYVILMLPDLRIVQISGFEEIDSYAEMEAVRNDALARLKTIENKPELAVNTLVGMPSEQYPPPMEGFEEMLAKVEGILRSISSKVQAVTHKRVKEIKRRGKGT